MKIIVTTSEGNDSNDWRYGYNVLMVSQDPSVEINFHDGEPEDASLGRDFSDVYKIPDMLKKAYEAGKRGEPFELDKKVEEE